MYYKEFWIDATIGYYVATKDTNLFIANTFEEIKYLIDTHGF